MVAGGPPGHVADAVLPLHLPAVRDLHLQTWRHRTAGQRASASHPPGLGPRPPPDRPHVHVQNVRAFWSSGGGDTRAGPVSPTGMQGHSRDTVLKEEGTTWAQPGGRRLPPRGAFCASFGIIFSRSTADGLYNALGKGQVQGAVAARGGAMGARQFPSMGRRPRPGQFAQVAVGRAGDDRASGKCGEGAPRRLLSSDPNVDGGDSLGHHPCLAPHRKLLA